MPVNFPVFVAEGEEEIGSPASAGGAKANAGSAEKCAGVLRPQGLGGEVTQFLVRRASWSWN
jgi:hypothetical protein